jgi:hypothetical protein
VFPCVLHRFYISVQSLVDAFSFVLSLFQKNNILYVYNVQLAATLPSLYFRINILS